MVTAVSPNVPKQKQCLIDVKVNFEKKELYCLIGAMHVITSTSRVTTSEVYHLTNKFYLMMCSVNSNPILFDTLLLLINIF